MGRRAESRTLTIIAVVCFVLVGGAAAMFLDGSPRTVLVALSIGAVVGLTYSLVSNSRANGK
ncbi:hypothetical protein [Sphaerimonospora mesophila]|uniref:hypothetical protein n=1 Tax=Sphaerimonospora mesophila TaxID=37483 RepID=UPI0006E20E4E